MALHITEFNLRRTDPKSLSRFFASLEGVIGTTSTTSRAIQTSANRSLGKLGKTLLTVDGKIGPLSWAGINYLLGMDKWWTQDEDQILAALTTAADSISSGSKPRGVHLWAPSQVRAAQTALGLEATGKLEAKTAAALDRALDVRWRVTEPSKLLATLGAPAPAPSPSPSPSPLPAPSPRPAPKPAPKPAPGPAPAPSPSPAPVPESSLDLRKIAMIGGAVLVAVGLMARSRRKMVPKAPAKATTTAMAEFEEELGWFESNGLG